MATAGAPALVEVRLNGCILSAKNPSPINLSGPFVKDPSSTFSLLHKLIYCMDS